MPTASATLSRRKVGSNIPANQIANGIRFRKVLYRDGNLVERFFSNSSIPPRRHAIRQVAENGLAIVRLASIRLWPRI
jgi:hypothetical protein